MNYICHVAILVALFVVLSSSLNLIAGLAGILSVAQAAFWGLGAYTCAIVSTRFGMSFLPALSISFLVCFLLGSLIGTSAIRSRGDSLVLATFAFQIVVGSLFMNWSDVTGGPMGISEIPRPVLWGWRIDTNWEFLFLAWGTALLTLLVFKCVLDAPLGRLLRSIREDEVLVAAMGKNVVYLRHSVFSLGAGLAGLAGVIYAYYMRFIDPSSFTVMESIFIISIVIIAGAGSLWGPVLGAVVLVSLPELLRFVGMPSSVAANMRQILYGAALVACMMWRPQGLIGEFSFRRSEKS